MKNSFRKNMVLSMIKTLSSIMFPLITYPYATRVLGVENFGKVSFGQSIIGYISIIASLGISTYATRDGGYYRSDRHKFDIFAGQLYSLNVLSTIVSYIVLLIVIACSITIRQYAVVIFIQSISILFITVGTDWVNIIFEDYLFITIRTLAVQVISVALLFLLVHDVNDYIKYAGIQVVSNGIVAVLNKNYIKKYCTIRLCNPNLKKHIIPITILFSNNLAVNIYCNSDITMIGFLCGDYYVGIYAFASKIYAILKQIIATAYTVTVTQMTEYIKNKQYDEYMKSLNDIINNIIFLSVPIITGVFFNAERIVVLAAGEQYIEATASLKILTMTVFLAVLGGALAYCVNLPLKREKINLLCTSMSAVENIILNVILITFFKIEGAAAATFLAEFSVVLILISGMKKYYALFNLKSIIVNAIKCLISVSPFVLVTSIVERMGLNQILTLLLIVFFSMVIYFVMNICLKNKCLLNYFKSFLKN